MEIGYPQFELLESCKEEGGALHLYKVKDGVFLSEAIGRLSTAAGEAYCRQGSAVLEGHERPHVFNDWGQMQSYASEARALLTKWASNTLRRGSQVDFFTTAALVSMGISTASIALVVVGIDIKNHSTIAEFQAALSAVAP